MDTPDHQVNSYKCTLLMLLVDLLHAVLLRVGYDGYPDEIFEIMKMIRQPYWSRAELTAFLSLFQEAMQARGYDVNFHIERPSGELFHAFWIDLDPFEEWFEGESGRRATGVWPQNQGIVNILYDELSKHLGPIVQAIGYEGLIDFSFFQSQMDDEDLNSQGHENKTHSSLQGQENETHSNPQAHENQMDAAEKRKPQEDPDSSRDPKRRQI